MIVHRFLPLAALAGLGAAAAAMPAPRSGPEGEPPEASAAVGADLKLFGSVRDEGLPREGTLTSAWRMVEGPGRVTFSAPDEPRTLARFDTPGTYALELRASDSVLETELRLVVHVTADARE